MARSKDNSGGMDGRRGAAYDDFWRFYLRAHADPHLRSWHYFGTALALCALFGLAATQSPGFFVLAVVGGYGPAWIGHFFIAGNHPATFSHPLWSLISDFRMFWLWITGNLEKELAKVGVPVRRQR
jgi:hypothetical protein